MLGAIVGSGLRAWCMLWTLWCWMVVFVECCWYVVRHEQIHGAVCIVPLDGDAAIQFTFPIGGQFVVFFEGVEKVINMLFADIFYAKVVDDEGE